MRSLLILSLVLPPSSVAGLPPDAAEKAARPVVAAAGSAFGPGFWPLSAAGAFQSRNSIVGMVQDSAHRPLSNLRVELLTEVDSLLTSARTDSAGFYRFSNLSTGTFQVRVVTAGTNFVSQTIRLTIVAVRGGFGARTEQADFTLYTREEAKGSPTVPANAGTTFVQEVPAEARKAYEQAVKLLERGKEEERGLAALRRALDLFPNYYLALERLGAEEVKREQYEEARGLLVRAVGVNPNGHAAFYALGVARYYLRELPGAVEALRRSLVLAPDSPNASFTHFYLGLAFLKSGKADDAETQFKRACETGGANVPAEAHLHLAQIYSNRRHYKEAADELELFLKRSPDARDADSIRELIRQLRAKSQPQQG